MGKQATVKTNWSFGEISPRNFGRMDVGKPVYPNAAAIIENFLISQTGGLSFWPGTRYICGVKTNSKKVRLERFAYSSSEQYVIEMGDAYFRFCSVVSGVPGQLVVSTTPVEVTTPYALADIPLIQMANKNNVMYLVHPSYYPQKLIRNSSTSFSIGNVPFFRGPFMDRNVGNVTITPSSATGATTLTATIPAWGTGTAYVPGDWVTQGGNTYACQQPHIAGTFATDLAAGKWVLAAFFKAGHVGSQWLINSAATVGGVVMVTGFTSATVVTGYVMAEGDGTAGNIGGTGAYTYWAEGAFSAVRGYPCAITFFEGRLLYGGTASEPQKWYASNIGAYDNFDTGAWNNTTTDSSAYAYEIDSNTGAAIRWLDSDSNLKIGTSSGTTSAVSPSTGTTYQNTPQIVQDTDYAVKQTHPEKIGGYKYFLQANGYQVRQLIYDLVISRDKSEDMNLLADHILRDGGGGLEIARQQSPNDRLWIPREDGQLAVFTRNVEQAVMGWARRVAGSTAMGPGIFESVCVLPQDGGDDLVFVSVKRNINGSIVRYIEFFTREIPPYDWDHVRVDCSLTFDNPITITAITNDNPCVVTAAGHGFTGGEQVKIDNVVGMTQVNFQHYLVVYISSSQFSLTQLDGTAIDSTLFGKYLSGGQVRKMVTTLTGLDHLNGEYVTVQADTGLPAATQTFLVVGGSITLPIKVAVAHVGLPYEGTIQFLPLGVAETQGRSRKVYISLIRVNKSSGGSFGKDINSQIGIIYPNQTVAVNPPPASVLYTGDIEVDFESEFAKDWQPVIRQTKPLPLNILAVIMTESVEAEK
jgi:hypothetical protein